MVAFLLERWAEEQAAAAVGDRAPTARALARAALSADRREPPQGPRRWPLAAVLALGALTALGTADATGDLLRLSEPALA
jgi:hypothetical protein